jgi:exonuclease III
MVTLNLCTWNVNGVRKLRQFFSRARQVVQTPDILCLQETWATCESDQLSIPNYVAFHAEAQLSQGHGLGGVSTYFNIDTFAHG